MVVSAWLPAACGNSNNPSAAQTVTPSKPFKLADVFPAGEGRDLVLNTCGSCHSVACSALGQRTAESWEGIKKGHKDKLTAYNSANVDAMFSYLKANFNDSKPEPKIPAEFVQQGCTP